MSLWQVTHALNHNIRIIHNLKATIADLEKQLERKDANIRELEARLRILRAMREGGR